MTTILSEGPAPERNAHVHPIFRGILAGVLAQPAQLQRAEYISLLKAADWTFEFSDDGEAYRRGREQFRRIRELAPSVDPDGALFAAARPSGHGIPTL